MKTFRVEKRFIDAHNRKALPALRQDYTALGWQLRRQGLDIDKLTRRAMNFSVALPSWGTGTGGTRFGVFKGSGEPRNILEKIDDCGTVHALTGCTGSVSCHFPWDKTNDPKAVVQRAREWGLAFDAVNSNTFQDQPGQPLSYKYGSLTHTDRRVRDQAVAHNLDCIRLGRKLGSKALTVWLADGTNFPGQQDFRRSLNRYLESLSRIYRALPPGWRLYIEHKCHEPAFYSTVLHDWGVSYYCAMALGPRALSLVDLGHHLPNANIEQITSRLIQFGKLGGFHFNDSKYGDDDLDAGSIKPFQLFLVFNELVAAEMEKIRGFDPCYMIDESHNVTDPLESLIMSATEIQRAYVQASLVDRKALLRYQADNDPLMALSTLKEAFHTDVEPILSMARVRKGCAAAPVALFRASGYRSAKTAERRPR